MTSIHYLKPTTETWSEKTLRLEISSSCATNLKGMNHKHLKQQINTPAKNTLQVSNTVVLHTDVAVIPEVNGSVCIITRCLQNTLISCTGPRHRCTLKLESESYLDAALARSLSVSIPARLPVQLRSFHPIRCCQNASSHDDDIRGFAVDNFLWSGVLLAQQISCKGGGRPRRENRFRGDWYRLWEISNSRGGSSFMYYSTTLC